MTETDIDGRRLGLLMAGAYRDGGLSIGEAVAAYQAEKITVSRAAEACGITWQEMADALRSNGVVPKMGPGSPDELHETGPDEL